MSLQGKQVAVLGAGRSGQAAARLVHHHGATVTLYDVGVINDQLDLPDGIETVSNADEDLGKSISSDLLVISPGIDTYGSYVKAFALGTQEVIGEVELATRYYNGKIIAITGTNGKTTTTELIQKIIETSGLSCVACGNYGVPVAEVVLHPDVPEVLALEVSSFQLETIIDFCPDVAIWLNFDADHMDRYTSIEDYKKAKLRIFENQTAQQVAIIKCGEDIGDIRARKVSFTSENISNDEEDYTLDGMTILRAGEYVVNMLDTKMRGLHNSENLMAACAAAHIFKVTNEQIEEALVGFSSPEHRCEFIREIHGVEYINDSKATNLHALDNALRSQIRPVVLIAGGKEKGLDYRPLLDRVKEKVREIIVLGEIAPALGELFSQVVSTHRVEDLSEAVSLSQELAQAGDVVLLSPGTSSFDMFKNGYEERGDAYRNHVLALK